MFKNMFLLKSKIQNSKVIMQQPRKFFSYQAKPPTQSYGKMAMFGAGTAGLVFLMLKGRSIGYQGYY
jgi:hypothetical protein